MSSETSATWMKTAICSIPSLSSAVFTEMTPLFRSISKLFWNSFGITGTKMTMLCYYQKLNSDCEYISLLCLIYDVCHGCCWGYLLLCCKLQAHWCLCLHRELVWPQEWRLRSVLPVHGQKGFMTVCAHAFKASVLSWCNLPDFPQWLPCRDSDQSRGFGCQNLQLLL